MAKDKKHTQNKRNDMKPPQVSDSMTTEMNDVKGLFIQGE
jgi:hypothetical protein